MSNTTATTVDTNTEHHLSYAAMAGADEQQPAVVESWEDIKPSPAPAVEHQQPPRHQQRPQRHVEMRGDRFSSERFLAWGEQHTRPLRLQDTCIFTHGEDGIWLVSSDFGKYEWTEVDNAMVPFNGTYMQWVYFRDLMHKKRINFEGEIVMRTIGTMCGQDVLLQRPPQRRRNGRGRGGRRNGGGGRGGGRYDERQRYAEPTAILTRQQERRELNFNRDEFPSLA